MFLAVVTAIGMMVGQIVQRVKNPSTDSLVLNGEELALAALAELGEWISGIQAMVGDGAPLCQ